MRLFAGIEIPEDARMRLSLLKGGLPGARWVAPESFHVTVRFFGDCDGTLAGDIDDALSTLRVRPFDLRIHGVGIFTEREPRVLWAGLAKSDALAALNQKVETAVQRVGLAPERRKFAPHITLARLKNPPKDRLAEFLSVNGGFSLPAFPVTHFTLFSSFVGHGGSRYCPERRYVM